MRKSSGVNPSITRSVTARFQPTLSVSFTSQLSCLSAPFVPLTLYLGSLSSPLWLMSFFSRSVRVKFCFLPNPCKAAMSSPVHIGEGTEPEAEHSTRHGSAGLVSPQFSCRHTQRGSNASFRFLMQASSDEMPRDFVLSLFKLVRIASRDRLPIMRVTGTAKSFLILTLVG